jgi:hypothetical protein
MTRWACVYPSVCLPVCLTFSPEQSGSVVDQRNKRRREKEFISAVELLYSYCFYPLELSICINAVGNHIIETDRQAHKEEGRRNDGRCASVVTIVSRVDSAYALLISIYSLEQMCRFSWRTREEVFVGVDKWCCWWSSCSGYLFRDDEQDGP